MVFAVSAAALLLWTADAAGQCAPPEQLVPALIAADAAVDDRLGSSVAISGNTVVAGAINDDHSGVFDSGSAYVFVASGPTWVQQAKLIASDPGSDDEFGTSTSISTDTAVIGAWQDDHAGGNNAGSAYVFVRVGAIWTQQAKLTASDAAAGDNFGVSVAISGNTAIVSALNDDHAAGTDAGAAYVYVRTGAIWAQQAKLTASDAAAFDRFGVSVAISGNTAIVGSLSDDNPGGTDAGSAYVFVRSGAVWSQQAKLTASDATGGEGSGWAVGISGETAVMGAPGDDHAGGINAGAVYVFVRSGTTWNQQAKLIASNAETEDDFGWSVGISGDSVIIGAYLTDTAPDVETETGSAYVFRRNGVVWTQIAELEADDAVGYDTFGYSVAISGSVATVGAPWHDSAPNAFDDIGGAYVFDTCPPLPTPGDLNDDGAIAGDDIQGFADCLLGGLPIGPCAAADMNADGILDAADLQLFIAALLG
jgi:hypothetical protein